MHSSISPRWLALLAVASLAIRVAVLASAWGTLEFDPDSYARLAVNWAHSGTFGFEDNLQKTHVLPTAYRPPLYPWLLSWLVEGDVVNTLGVAGLHVVLGVATVLIVYVVAARLAVRWPFVPALAVSCDPILLRGSQLVMTETVVTCLAVTTWAVWLRLTPPGAGLADRQPSALSLDVRDDGAGECCSGGLGLGGLCLGGLWLGGLFGLSVLTRPTMLPWAGLSLLLLPAWRTGGGRRWSLFAVAVLVFIACLVPWAARNVRQFGRPILTTTHGGYTLLLANNPLLYEHFRVAGPSRDWDATNFHSRWAARASGDPTEEEFWFRNLERVPAEPPIRELAEDRLAQEAAIATIRRQPWMFWTSCVYRAGWLWALAPNEGSRLSKLAIGLWYAAWFALALAGAWRLGYRWLSRSWLMPAALLVTLTGIHAIYWSNMRMRAPMMPVVYVVAALPLRKSGSSTSRQ